MSEEWISVEDRLPEKADIYMAFFNPRMGDHFVGMAHYLPQTKEWMSGPISHWMRLPSPPTDKGQV